MDDKIAIYFGNRSTAFYHLQEYEQSLDDANKALALDQKYLKAYLRKASALFEMDKLKVQTYFILHFLERKKNKGSIGNCESK